MQAKFSDEKIAEWAGKAEVWLKANTSQVPATIRFGRDAWTVAHACGITEEAYKDRSVLDAHIQTALEKIFRKAIFLDPKRY